MPKLQGFQIANASGENIQGDDNCPFDLPSFAIIDLAGVQIAAELMAKNDILLLFQPIFEGDIQQPSFPDAGEVQASFTA